MALQINEELRSLIPPLSPEEAAQLEANILRDGCHDPLIIWQETKTLLDGHHRYEICTRHGRPYHIQEIRLPDMDAAKAWMITNQLGRRNLTPEQLSYFRGEQYNLQKQQGKRTDLTSRQNGEKSPNIAPTLATMHKVGVRTIERDGAYAAAVEALAAVLGPEVRQAILAGQFQLTKADVPLLATLVQASPETATAVRDAVQGADPAPALRAIVTAARCGICHRPLSNPVSVSRGIGPICAGHGSGGHRTGASGGGSLAALPRLSAPEPVAPPPSLEALFPAALRSLVALHAGLADGPLPAILDPYVEVGRRLNRAMADVSDVLRQHPGIFRLPTTVAPPKVHTPKRKAGKKRLQVRRKEKQG